MGPVSEDVILDFKRNECESTRSRGIEPKINGDTRCATYLVLEIMVDPWQLPMEDKKIVLH